MVWFKKIDDKKDSFVTKNYVFVFPASNLIGFVSGVKSGNMMYHYKTKHKHFTYL